MEWLWHIFTSRPPLCRYFWQTRHTFFLTSMHVREFARYLQHVLLSVVCASVRSICPTCCSKVCCTGVVDTLPLKKAAKTRKRNLASARVAAVCLSQRSPKNKNCNRHTQNICSTWSLRDDSSEVMTYFMLVDNPSC